MSATCNFLGCDRQARTMGLCNGHYLQQRKHIVLMVMSTQQRTPRLETAVDFAAHVAETTKRSSISDENLCVF